MGRILRAKCKMCGYKSESLYYGGGFRNFIACCKYPVLDKIEKEVRMANILDRGKEIKQNPNLHFYDDESLSDTKAQNRDCFHKWDIYKVYYDGYFCPKCNQYSLGFESAGCWD